MGIQTFTEACVEFALREAGIIGPSKSVARYRSNLLAYASDPILADACRPFVPQKIPTLKGNRRGRSR